MKYDMKFYEKDDGANDPGTGGNAGSDSGATAASADDKKSFTQAELNAQFAARGEQAKRSLLAEIGVDSVDAAKAVIQAQKTAEEASKSEEQRLKDQIKALETERDTAKKAEESALEREKTGLMKTAVLLAANDFNDPNDAWEFVDRTGFSLADDGKVTGVDEALKKLREQKQYLLKAGSTGAHGTPPPRRGNLGRTKDDEGKRTTAPSQTHL